MGAYAHGHTHAHTHTVTIAERRDPRCAEHWRAGGDGGQGSAVWRGKSQQARVGHPPVIQADRRQDGEDAPVEHGHQVDKLVWWARKSGRWHGPA